jgi:hypothetical protein
MGAIADGRENGDLELMRKEEDARLPYLAPQLNPNHSAISQMISTIQGGHSFLFFSLSSESFTLPRFLKFRRQSK